MFESKGVAHATEPAAKLPATPPSIVAGHAGNLVTGTYSKMTCSMADLYQTVANRAIGAEIEHFPTGGHELRGVVA